MTKTVIPEELQTRLDPVVVDNEVAKAKGKLLSDIKRSVYVYRVDCGGCNACEIEIFSSITPVFDVERFGIKVVPTPRHADILVYTGAVTRSMRMPALRAYEAAPDPKIIVSYGACGCTGGIFHDNYCVWGRNRQDFAGGRLYSGLPSDAGPDGVRVCHGARQAGPEAARDQPFRGRGRGCPDCFPRYSLQASCGARTRGSQDVGLPIRQRSCR